MHSMNFFEFSELCGCDRNPIGVLIKARRINFLHYLLSRGETEMLFQVFITQWRNPFKGDWTETAKENLGEFNIPCDFNFIRSKSKESFKRIVKVKAQEYALKILTEKQQKHSKMENLIYTQLKPQKYLSLETIQVEQIRNIFQHRTRMAPYGENFRGKRVNVTCPLCHKHLDNQSMSFQCEALLEKVEINCDQADVYKDEITIKTAKTLTPPPTHCIKIVVYLTHFPPLRSTKCIS